MIVTLLKLRWLKPAVGLVLLAGAAVVVTDQFSAFQIRKLKGQIEALEAEKAELALYAERLCASRRVAQLDVLEQSQGEDGPVTVMRWQQIALDGRLAAPEIVTIQGRQVYLEAMVVKFQHELIGRGADGERSASLALFRRAFGERQAPVTGHPLDQTAPGGYAGPALDAAAERLGGTGDGRRADARRGEHDTDASRNGSDAGGLARKGADAAGSDVDPLDALREGAAAHAAGGASAYEQKLWKRFLDLLDDTALAAEYGVRVAQFEAPSVLVRAGQTWEVTLDAAGGLNLRKLADSREPQNARDGYH